MKNIIILLALTTLLSCQDGTGSNDSNNKDSADFDIRGAYSMIKQVGNDGTKDTLLKKEQLKIFSDKFMMYASPRATDSFGEYGIAIYRQNRDTVKEYIFYTSSAGEVRDTALLHITKLPEGGYRQVIRYQDTSGTFILTEDYDKVGREPSSPLDGAWTQVRDIVVNKNGDTTRNAKKTQFKIYESGYFIWANPNKDPSSNNFYSAYGYGTFKMLNDNKTQETNINSTFYSSLVGKPVDIDIQMNGKDGYTQVINQANGDKSIEVYERLK